jgi:MFS family permease
LRQVFRIPVYRRLLVAYGLNELTWGIGTVALAILVYRRTGSALGSAAFFLCSQFVPALVSPLIVARVAGHGPRRLLPGFYLLEAILFGVLAWMSAHFSLVPVLAVALVDGAVALSARVLSRAATVEVLRPLDLLHEGNASTNFVFTIGFMAGPALGGVVVATGGTVAALLVNCALFAGVTLVLAATADLPNANPEETREGSAWQRLWRAVAHVRADPAARCLLILQGVGMVVFTISTPVEVVFAQHTLHAGAGGYGAMLSGWGAGAVVGGAAYARWRRRSGRGLITLSAAALAAGFAIIAAAPGIVVAVAGSAVAGSGNGVGFVAERTMLQEYTPQRWMSLVMSLNESLSQATPGLGFLLGGTLAYLADPRAAFAVAAAGSVVFTASAWILLGPARIGPPPTPPAGVSPEPAPERVPTAAGGRGTLV